MQEAALAHVWHACLPVCLRLAWTSSQTIDCQAALVLSAECQTACLESMLPGQIQAHIPHTPNPEALIHFRKQGRRVFCRADWHACTDSCHQCQGCMPLMT